MLFVFRGLVASDLHKGDVPSQIKGSALEICGLEKFFRGLGLPVNLNEALGFTPEAEVISELAKNALPWGETPAGGYAPFTLEDAEHVLREACK